MCVRGEVRLWEEGTGNTAVVVIVRRKKVSVKKVFGVSRPGVAFGDRADLYISCRCGQQQGVQISGLRPKMLIFMAHLRLQPAETCWGCDTPSEHPGDRVAHRFRK